MSTAPAVPGRWVCTQCGANNFDTQAACWKCGTALNAARPSAPAGTAAAPAAPPLPGRSASAPPAPVPAAYNAPRTGSIDPAVAIWAAVALAAFFPYVAVPVGIVFLMLDDGRRAAVGRVALIWGIVFSILHYLVTGWIIAASIQQIQRTIGLPGGLRLPTRTQSAPDMNQEVPPIQFPGLNR